jgi:arginine repressor
VAVALDNKRLPEVAGTLAGDDTIFVAVRSRSVQGRVVALLNAWMQST